MSQRVEKYGTETEHAEPPAMTVYLSAPLYTVCLATDFRLPWKQNMEINISIGSGLPALLGVSLDVPVAII